MSINYELIGEDAHMIVAIRRCSPNKNENVGLPKLVRRKIVSAKFGDKDYKEQLKILEKSVSNFPGYWRMYRSVNKRNLTKGKQLLQIKLIERGEDFNHRIGSEWKSLLMKRECKSERKFLLDIDSTDITLREKVIQKLKDDGVELFEENATPNGYHIITSPFNSIILDEFEDVGVKKDDLFFLYDFGDNSN
jgi:hypothetical protein